MTKEKSETINIIWVVVSPSFYLKLFGQIKLKDQGYYNNYTHTHMQHIHTHHTHSNTTHTHLFIKDPSHTKTMLGMS